MTDIQELKRLAEAATPGPWENGCYEVYEVNGSADRICKGASAEDSAFIAAANPTAILSLLTRIEALEQDAKHLHVKLAGEKLRADQGWERYEASNKAHMACLNERAAEIGKAMEG